METAVITAWTFQAEIPIPQDVAPLMVTGEQPVAAYSTFRDSAVFTTKRLIVRDAQGITGTLTDTLTTTGALTGTWNFPTEGLQPYTYTEITDSPLEGMIDSSDMWHVARVALTAYEMLDAKAWGILALIILIPVALGLTYKIFTNPPEI